MTRSLQTYLEERRTLVDAYLMRELPAATERPSRLHAAMRYSIESGGKRLRPILCLAACEAAGGDPERALRPAAAIELLHTYTLVHDDLPAMDNDDLRRGRATVHKAYDEATAILTGDALLTLAFEWMAASPPPAPYPPTSTIIELARAGGSRGVIAGQMEDIASEGHKPSSTQLEFIHAHKTGDLIVAAVRIGAILAGANAPTLETLTRYARKIGLAFQIADDVLNATSTAEVLGKAAGSDAAREKMTYVALYGVDWARAEATRQAEGATSELRPIAADMWALTELARHMVDRIR